MTNQPPPNEPSGWTRAIVSIGGIVFDEIAYDETYDTLDVRVAGAVIVDADVSEESDSIKLDADDVIVGMSINDARWRIGRDGILIVTLGDGRVLRSTDAAGPIG